MSFNMRLVASLALALVAAAGPSGRTDNDADAALIARADTKVAIVTCMDPRIEMDFILKQLKLAPSNSYIIRNAGGRAKEAIRSVVMTQEYLGTNEIHIIHHTECGMADKSDETIRRKFYHKGDFTRALMVDNMSFLPIRNKNYTESVLDDIALMENCPLIKPDSKVTGWVYMIGVGGTDTMKQVYP